MKKNRLNILLLSPLKNPALGQFRASNELNNKKHGLKAFLHKMASCLDRKLKPITPGYLGSQDTYYVGTMKGVGRIYQQTFIDTYSRVAFAKLYTEKTAITAAEMLNDRVLPWFEEQETPLLRVLTDRGTEYCGKVDHHAYQLYLALENIDHSKTKVRHPQTNGICERFHRSMKEEFYDIAFRKKIYSSLEELQTDVDAWLQKYNHFRGHSGRYCYGKTPYQTFQDSKKLAFEKNMGKLFEETSDSVSCMTA
jgi:transposase InsO family protein